MKMMDMAYDGMLDEAFLGTTTATTAPPTAAMNPEETGYSDLSIPSSAISTPGTGIGGRQGAIGAGGIVTASASGVSGGRGEAPTTAGGGAGGWSESGDPGSVSNASHAGSGVGGAGGANSNTTKSRVQLPASCDPPLPDAPTKPLVWIVFGGTGHMGRSLVKSALAHGDYVTTVGRLHETSMAAMQALAASAAEHGPDDDSTSPAASTASPAQSTASTAGAAAAGKKKMRCLGTLCDVRARESVDRVVQRTIAHFGRIDVVANCSGYGVVGACEDQDEYELRNQFETNYMGTLHILQATLPILRRQQELMLHQQQVQGSANSGGGGNNGGCRGRGGGRYLIFSSTAGALGVPGLGPYCATKYAVEGLIEAMLYEVDAFNIKATLVEPGLMRRDDRHWEAGDVDPLSAEGGGGTTTRAGRSSGNRGDNTNPLPTWGHFLIKPPSESYAHASAPSLHATRMVQWLGDRQPASVVQCAELVWQLAHCSFPPLRLPLGSYAIESIRDRLRSVTEEIEDWKHLNFPLPPDAAGPPTGAPGAAAHGVSAPPMAVSSSAATTATLTTSVADKGATTDTATSAPPSAEPTTAADAAANSVRRDDEDEEMFDIGS